MLGLFSKKAMILGAPAAGQLLDITQVNDPFFASKNLGDGVAVIPQSQTVCAPCDGRLVMVFETRHAFGIRCGEVEVLSPPHIRRILKEKARDVLRLYAEYDT